MLLATIHDADIGSNYTFPATFDTRTAARAFLFDDDGLMAYMWSDTDRQHKLPGGGVEEGETPEQALIREMHEETGCAIRNVTYLGYAEEYRGQGGFKQTSHLFIAHVAGAKGTPAFDASEHARGFVLKWLPPMQALALVTAEAGNPDYGLNFQNARERKLFEFLPV